MKEFEALSLRQVLEALTYLVVRDTDSVPHGVITSAGTFINHHKRELQSIERELPAVKVAARMYQKPLGWVGSLVAAAAGVVDPLDAVVFLLDSARNGYLVEAAGFFSEVYANPPGAPLTMRDVESIMRLRIVEGYPYKVAVPAVAYRAAPVSDTRVLGASLEPLRLSMENL